EKEITLRERPWPESSAIEQSPVAVPSLGLTYKVLAKVAEVDPDSPAAKAELTKDGEPAKAAHFAAGDEIVEASLKLPELTAEQETDQRIAWPQAGEPLPFGTEKANW